MANIITGNSYKAGDLLLKYTETGVPVFQWFLQRYKGLPYLFFDVEEFADPNTGNNKILFKFKNVDGVTAVTTETGNSVKYWERKWRPIEVAADGDQGDDSTKVNTIKIKPLNGFSISDLSVDDVVYIYSSSDNTDYQRRIVNIDTGANTITIEGDGITVKDNDVIQFAYNVKNEGDVINKTFDLQKFDEFETFYQFVTAKVQFSPIELNKTYEFPGSVQELVDMKLKNTFNRTIEQLAKVIWTGRNLGPTEGKQETLGILTGIEKMAAETGQTFTHDLSTYSSYDDKVTALLDIFNEAFESGVYTGTITVVGNSKALFNLMKTNGSWYKLTGIEIKDSPSDPIKLGIKRLDTGRGFNIEFFADPMLDVLTRNSKKYGDSLMVILPRERMKLYQRPYDGVQDISGKLSTYGPGLSFRNISDIVNADTVGRPSIFVGEGHFATILPGLKYGAYRIVKGY